MRKVALACGFAGALLAGNAQAQVFSWTGFYIGGHAGGAESRHDWTQIDNNQGNALDRSREIGGGSGLLGGAQAGFNLQTGAWVAGIEADISGASHEGCARLVIFSAYENCARSRWFGTAALRLGYTFDRTLVYGKAGLAFSGRDYFVIFNGVRDTQIARGSETGWMLGAGFEYAVAPAWSVKLEYNYLDFGDADVRFEYPPGSSSPGLIENWDAHLRTHLVKVGLNYRFAGTR